MEAIHLLREKNIRRLPVMKGEARRARDREDAVRLHAGEGDDARPVGAPLPALEDAGDGGDEREAAHGQARDADLTEAAKLLRDRKLNGVIVVDEQGDLVGILTTTNALEALIHFSKA